MRDAASFADRANWSLGLYSLDIELGDSDDDALQRALSTLWQAAGIEGCFGVDDDWWPDDQIPLACTVSALLIADELWGRVVLPNGHRVICRCLLFRHDGTDELGLYLPMGALALAEPRSHGYVFDTGNRDHLAWRRPLDDWLADIATRIYSEVPFRAGMIGFELDPVRADELHVPDQRWDGYLVVVDGRLVYMPANN